MNISVDYIRERLFELRDSEYRDFNAKLIPTVEKERVIGVRTPALRSLAKQLARDENIGVFLDALPHYYFEENNLHAFIIETVKDFETAIEMTERFLPYIDSWATCDQLSPKVFGKHPDIMIEKCREWIHSGKTYTVRYGIGTLMRYFLDKDFKPEYLELAAEVKSEEYYIEMMQAWFFATALAKQYDSAVRFLEERRLSVFVHNKTIQKARESFRISDEKKSYLKTLKINE